MRNDLIEVGASLGDEDLKVAATVSKHQISRIEAELWAVKDCKFLIFDDAETDTDGEDTDDEESILARAMTLSMQKDDDCVICSSCPEFPHNRKTKNFRLFRPADAFPELLEPQGGLPRSVNICLHYVAISYCWPIPQKDDAGRDIEPPRHYQVRDLDGTVRKNRALDDVLDRAVDVANSCGLRMIWIDQECLPQNLTDDSPDWEKHDKQLGVQAMDIIYNRASFTAGLHDLELASQRQLDAIQTFSSENGEFGSMSRTFSLLYPKLQDVLEFLDNLSRDRWYTRAWVIQEAISAGNGLALVFRRAAGLKFASKFRIASRARSSGYPGCSLDKVDRGCPSEVVCLPVSSFRLLARRVQTLVQQTSFGHIGTKLVRDTSMQRSADQVMASVRSLFPEAFKPKHFTFNVQMFGGNNFGTRPTVDAAGALTLLKTRHCRDNEDRIAIVANMCGYEYRLDPKAVAAHCDSLRVAILALSLLNGDLSLLVPEVYSTSAIEIIPRDTEDGRIKRSHLWVHPFGVDSMAIDHVQVRGFSGAQTQRHYDMAKEGMRVDAYLWEIQDSDEIDLTPIKVQWEHDWAEIQCIRVLVDKLKDESLQQFRTRKSTIVQNLSREGVSQAVKKDLLENGVVSDDCPVWRGLDKRGVIIERHLVADRVEAGPDYQLVIARIFFGLLRFLLCQSDDDPRMLGLANSIWQSTRVDEVASQHPPLPDIVCEALFDHPAVVETPFRTLNLHQNRDGGYHQTWLIDRIMSRGSLWVGRYMLDEKLLKRSADIKPHANRNADPRTLDAGLSDQTSLDIEESGDADELESPRSLLQRQMQRQMFSELAKIQTFATYMQSENMDRVKHEDSMLHIKNGSIASFAEVVRYNIWTREAEQRRVRQLVSVFDVDGPCIVATPYNSQWEMIPSPELRSMSVCWIAQRTRQPRRMEKDVEGSVVEELQQGTDQLTQGSTSTLESQARGAWKIEESLKVTKKVRGMWQIMDIPARAFGLS